MMVGLLGEESLGETKSKATSIYAQGEQFRNIVERRGL